MATFIDINVVIPQHQEILDRKASVLPTLRDVSKYAVKGASSVDFPTLAPRAGQSIALGGSFTVNNANYGNDSFLLNEILGDAFSIDLHQEEENILNNLEDSSRETLHSIAKQADASCISKMITAATLMAGAPSASLYDDLVDMAKLLDDADVPAEDRYVAVTNADYAVLSKEIKDFIRFNTDKSGVVGEILGMKVVRCTAAELSQTMVYHKNAVAYCWHGTTKFIEEPSATAVSQTYSISRKFGAKAVQSGAMIVKRTNV